MSYANSNKNWEGLADRDMLWAILTDPNKKNKGWSLDEFFQSGEKEVDFIIRFLSDNNMMPDNLERALDFGCGVGRISRALSTHFNHTTGIDISEKMIQSARELNSDLIHKLDFKLNESPQLDIIDNNSLDFILTVIVLQHIPSDYSKVFIKSFLQKLKKGGVLVFQIPTKDIRKLSLLQWLKSKIKIRERLALIGIGQGYHMHMYPVPEDEIQQVVNNSGGEIVSCKFTNQTDPAYNGNIEFVDKKDSHDYYSQLFVVRKS